MANTDLRNGAIPCNAHGGHYVGSVNMYYLPTAESNDIAVGDFVIMGGTGDDDGVPSVARATAGSTDIVGVVVGFKPDAAYLDDTHRTASTERYCFVADDPDQLFMIQEDDGGTALTKAEIGQNCDLLVSAGVDTTTGLSQMEIDRSTVGTTNGQLRLLGLEQAPNNEFGDWANWIVRVNEHAFGKVGGV
jgi:hypothetical protein